MLQEMTEMRNTLAVDIAHALQMVKREQSEHHEKTSKLHVSLEAHVVKHCQERPVNVDFGEVRSLLRENTESFAADFERMHTKIESLSQDLAHGQHLAKEVAEMKMATDVAPSSASESNWTQTDIVETNDGFSQTDDKFWQSRMGKAKSERKTQKVEVVQEKKVEDQDQKKVQGKKVFVDAEAMKRQARQKLLKKPYNVFDFYHPTGCAQKIARTSAFENMTFLVVIFNALWISVDADHNKADMLIDAHPIFQIAENSFCLYFTWELLTRFCAFKRKLNCLKDGWFVFDLTLVVLMILETWVLTVVFILIGTSADIVDASMLRLVRIVKILRLSRLARLMRAVPEILIFIKGIGAASRSVQAGEQASRWPSRH